MKTARIENTTKYGTEIFVFAFGEMIAGEDIDSPANRVRIDHADSSGATSSMSVSRTVARKWWADAIRDGGRVISRGEGEWTSTRR